jgi:hypothetical protein
MRNLVMVLLMGSMMIVSAPASAMSGKIGILTWSYSLPMSDTRDFIENDSWVGATLEGRQLVDRRTSVSASIGFLEFYENSYDPIDFTNGTVTGQQYRNLQMVPILVGAQRYFGDLGQTRPYVGLSIGALYVDQLMDIGLYSLRATNWHFMGAPEFGVMMPALFGGQGNTVVSIRYSYPFEAGEYLGGQSLSLSSWTIAFGFSWQSR